MKQTVNLTQQDDQFLQKLVATSQKTITDLTGKKWARPQDEFKGRKKLRSAVKQLTHGRILLQAAQAAGDPLATEATIAESLWVNPELVELVCKRYVENGLELALKPVLTETQRALVDVWYREHGVAVIKEVRQWLRQTTKHRTGATTSAVAQSVWASFADNHFDQTIDPSDPQCAWGILARAAKRHCEAWIRYGRPGKGGVSIDGLARGSSDDDAATRFDPKDTREPQPVAVLIRNECAALFTALDAPERDGIAQAVQSVEGGMELIPLLTPLELQVLGLKLAKKTRDEIAKLLRIDHGEVDDCWRSIRRIAEGLDDAEDDEE